MRIFSKVCILVGMAFCLTAISAQATVITLNSSNVCSPTNDNGDITVNDVEGATNCFGVFSGNLNSNDQISYMGTTYNELTKIDGAGSAAGTADIGFQITGANSTSGSWSFNQGSLNGDFLVLLKAARSFAVWSFEGGDALAFMGDWTVNLKNGGGNNAALSHISIYGSVDKTTPPPVGQNISEPTGLAVFLFGMGIFAYRRTKK